MPTGKFRIRCYLNGSSYAERAVRDKADPDANYFRFEQGDEVEIAISDSKNTEVMVFGVDKRGSMYFRRGK